MTNRLTDAQDTEAIAEIVVTTVSDMLRRNAACICFDEKGVPEKAFIQRRADSSVIRRELSGADELRRRVEQLHSSVETSGQDCLYPSADRRRCWPF